MGCTPSIHVNQTGFVYCRDSDELTSQHTSQTATITAGKAVVLAETTELSHSSSSGRVKRRDNTKLIEFSRQGGSEVSELLIAF